MTVGIEDQLIQAEGSEQFVRGYDAELKKQLGKGILKLQIKRNYQSDLVSAEWTVSNATLNGTESIVTYRRILTNMLLALEHVLQSSEYISNVDAKIKIGKVTLYVDGNVTQTLRNGEEITYIGTYKLQQKLKPKVKSAIEDITEYFCDTCTTEINDYTLTIDRFHTVTPETSIPSSKMQQMLIDTAFILQQYSPIQTVDFEIRKVRNIEC